MSILTHCLTIEDFSRVQIGRRVKISGVLFRGEHLGRHCMIRDIFPLGGEIVMATVVGWRWRNEGAYDPGCKSYNGPDGYDYGDPPSLCIDRRVAVWQVRRRLSGPIEEVCDHDVHSLQGAPCFDPRDAGQRFQLGTLVSVRATTFAHWQPGPGADVPLPERSNYGVTSLGAWGVVVTAEESDARHARDEAFRLGTLSPGREALDMPADGVVTGLRRICFGEYYDAKVTRKTNIWPGTVEVEQRRLRVTSAARVWEVTQADGTLLLAADEDVVPDWVGWSMPWRLDDC